MTQFAWELKMGFGTIIGREQNFTALTIIYRKTILLCFGITSRPPFET